MNKQGIPVAKPDPLVELGKKYRASLPHKRRAICEAWQCFARSGDTGRDPGPLSVLVHRLAGSGASYGYIEISECAIRFEDMLDEWLAVQSGDADLGPLESALGELLQVIARAYDAGPDE